MVGEETPVLIVGGSLVGLSTAVFLGHHGIPSLVLERHAGTAIHPRAAAVTQRTMENYRAVGLEPEIERVAEEEFVQNGAIMAVESLGGKELDWFFRFVNEGVEEISPSKRIFVTQIGLEPVLSRAAAELGAAVHHGTEARIEGQDDDGVTVVARSREDGSERTIRARYVVAADGAHSPIRQQLGIRNLGHGSFSDCITIYFRADVRALIGDRNLSVVYVLHPRLQGFFRFSIDLQSGFLAVFSTVDDQGERSRRVGEDMSAETCIGYVRDALGDPAIPVEIESVQRWAATAEYAERLRDGNVFLAGDSAHVMPPTGGFGGNCGVQDGYDLAWKLAHVLDGRAGESLLDTYDAERQPVGALTTEQAYTRYVLRVDPSLGKDDLVPVVHEVPIELGYRYRSAAIAGTDDDEAMWEDTREPSGRPGFRAPHAWIQVGGETRSTLDLFGGNFVLVAGPGGEAWRGAAANAGEALGVGIDVHRIGADIEESAGVLPALYGTGDEGAALVRPDGFVAWRAATAAEDCDAALAAAIGTALGRAATRV
jgi:2-polyprenyl-6-methoxyphenol hydroxylase-like FAD-dependent oxidoreductase